MDHPRLGELKVVGQAINMMRTPEPARMRYATPDLGQHSDELLRELGYNDAAIADLRARDVL
jgi:formyl-CoA transferase